MVYFFGLILLILFKKVVLVDIGMWQHLYIKNILNNTIDFTIYKIISFKTWIILACFSLAISGLIYNKIEKNKKFNQTGIMNFDERIKKLTTMHDNKNVAIKTGVLLGYTKRKKEQYCPDDAKHVFCCGTTGSGKTVALCNFVKRAIEKNYGLLIIDGKGDTGNGSIFNFVNNECKRYNKKIYIINMNNSHISDKYNPFINANSTMIKDMLINLTNWSEEHYKLNVERYLQRVITLVLKECKYNRQNVDLEKIVNTIDRDNFIDLSKQIQKLSLITKDEHLKNLNLADHSSKIAEDASARFCTILESDIGQIFNSNGIDILTALKEKAIIFFILNPLIYPETAEALGRLALIDSKKAVSNMFNTCDRTFFVFDEVNVYANKTLLNLINKSRSANVTCILAAQTLADLESAETPIFKEQILENCNNYIIMRQNTFRSAEEWSKTIGTHECINITYQLDGINSTGKGSARRVRQFLIHPDEIKSLGVGEAYFISKDKHVCEFIRIKM